jgi:hypothetical protein
MLLIRQEMKEQSAEQRAQKIAEREAA